MVEVPYPFREHTNGVGKHHPALSAALPRAHTSRALAIVVGPIAAGRCLGIGEPVRGYRSSSISVVDRSLGAFRCALNHPIEPLISYETRHAPGNWTFVGK